MIALPGNARRRSIRESVQTLQIVHGLGEATNEHERAILRMMDDVTSPCTIDRNGLHAVA